MHLAGVLVFVLSTIVVLVNAQNKYTNKYDNVDIERILSNERILGNYIKCLMEEGPCTPDARELKKTLPDALEGGCSKCNPKQKQTAEKVIKHLIEKRTKDWDRLSKKYDPQGVYKKRYDEALAKTNKSS